MKQASHETAAVAEPEIRSYSASVPERGPDILLMPCRSEQPLLQKSRGQRLGRSMVETYRMVSCRVSRNDGALVDDNCHVVTTKRFDLSPIDPPMHSLLFKAMPMM